MNLFKFRRQENRLELFTAFRLQTIARNKCIAKEVKRAAQLKMIIIIVMCIVRHIICCSFFFILLSNGCVGCVGLSLKTITNKSSEVGPSVLHTRSAHLNFHFEAIARQQTHFNQLMFSLSFQCTCMCQCERNKRVVNRAMMNRWTLSLVTAAMRACAHFIERIQISNFS